VKYYVTLGSREWLVEVDGDRVRVGGGDFSAHLTGVPGTPLRLLQLGDRVYQLTVEPGAPGEWQVEWRGTRHGFGVMDERARYVSRIASTGPRRTGSTSLKAPMPGLVVRVLVEPGQAVKAGAGLVVLEAMKMENELRAPADLTVRRVLVSPGNAVERGQSLVEFGESGQ
jgi:biotin carboxyl carrier protein